MEIYSTGNIKKDFIAEISVTPMKNRVYSSMTTVCKNVYIDLLNDILRTLLL